MALTIKQKAFADYYIELGNATEAARRAGYAEKYTNTNATKLLQNTTISAYIAERQKEIEATRLMTLQDIQEFRAKVIRGEEKDAFGLDVSVTDKLKAANDLEKALKIKAEQEEKKRREEEARKAKDYHTDLDIIADTFHPSVRAMRRKKYREFVYTGGRGSTKSSVGTELPLEILMNNPNVHAIALRQVANTLRDSIYAQFQWSAEKQAENPLFVRDNWDFKLSPLEITYKPTGQKIFFRGADDPGKIKSIKVPFGYIGVHVWEEFDQFDGLEAVRKIEQSITRGGDDVWSIKMFNPPINKNHWANVYVNTPKESMLVHKSSYLDVPPEWLGKAFIEEAEHLKKVNPDAYAHEYLGESIGLGREIFKFVEIREITDEEISQQERIYQGQDWGWSPDPKAFVRLSYSRATETVMAIDELGGTCIRTKDMAQQIKDKGYDDYEIRCGVDEPEHITDYRDAGLPAKKAIVTPGSLKRTFEWLQCRKIIVDPKRTPNLHRELVNYMHEVDKNGVIVSGYPDKDNHYIDAMRYATSPLSMKRGESA